jgi:hypothetical protein
MAEVCHGLCDLIDLRAVDQLSMWGALAPAPVGLGRLGDGSVGPDGRSEDEGERQGVAGEERTPQ